MKRSVELSYLSRNERLGWGVIALISAIILFLFSFRDIVILLGSSWPHLYGVIGVSRIRWEEIVFYLPHATSFSWGDLVPLFSGVDDKEYGNLLPQIPFILLGLFYKIFSFSDVDLFLLLTHSVMPLANFWLAFLIYRPFIRQTWAIFLSFLAVFYSSSFSSIDYVLRLLTGVGGFVELSSIQPLEITRFPFPGISLIAFSVVFFLCIRERHLSLFRVFFFGILWGIQVYVYPFNFVAGTLFFLFWIVYSYYLYNGDTHFGQVVLFLITGLVALILSLVPYMLTLMEMNDGLHISYFLNQISWVERNEGIFISEWGWLLAYGFPSLFVLVTLLLFRGDFYELVYRFAPIFSVMLVDFFVGSIHLLTGHMFEPELYQHRISGILFRFFYFVPFLYFVQMPLKMSYRTRHVRYHNFVKRIHGIFDTIIVGKRYVICGAIILLLSAIEVMGAIKQFNMHQNYVASPMEKISEDFSVISQNTDFGMVVLDEPVANLLVPTVLQRPSLLIPSYGNFVPEEEIRSRMILYAKLIGWDRQQFIDFMEPSSKKRRDIEVINSQIVDRGLGWWILYHDLRLEPKELSAWMNNIGKEFEDYDVDAGIKRFNVKSVLSKQPFETNLSVNIKRIGHRYLTTMNGGGL